MSRTYWEPSVAPVGLVPPEMVKLKVLLYTDKCLFKRQQEQHPGAEERREGGRGKAFTSVSLLFDFVSIGWLFCVLSSSVRPLRSAFYCYLCLWVDR